MRDWIIKWQKLIIIIISVVFIGGTVWWSLGSFLTDNQSSANTNTTEYVPNRTEAYAVVTKDGTDLSYQYWVMPREVSEELQNIITYNKQQNNVDVDELFQEPYLELTTAQNLIDEKVMAYWASLNAAIPTNAQLDTEVSVIANKNYENPEYKAAIDSRYGSLDAYKLEIRDAVRRQVILNNVKAKVAKASEEEMQKYYNENLDQIKKDGEMIKAAHILVDSEATATDLLAKLNAGEISFTDAASSYSLDTSNNTTGGDLQWFGRDKMVAEFTQAAFSATPGVLTGPVKTSYGYHIIRVDEKKEINTFTDFVSNTDLYDKAVASIETSKFDTWLLDYKKADNFNYQINDDVISVYQKYQDETENDTTGLSVPKFKEWLDPFVLITDQGTPSINREIDPRIIALYFTVLDEIDKQNAGKLESLDRYSYLAKTALEKYLGFSVEELNKMIEEAQSARDAETDSLKKQELLLNTLELKDAVEYKDLKKQLEDWGINPEDAQVALKELDIQSKTNLNLKIECLTDLYEMNTTSKAVIDSLHQLQPDNIGVSLKWYQNSILEMSPYLQNEQFIQVYGYIFETQFQEIQLGLLDIAQNIEASKDIRIAAYEELATFLDILGRYEEELIYLKQLRVMNPDYPEINAIIDQMTVQVEEILTAKAEAEASDTVVSTPTATGTN